MTQNIDPELLSQFEREINSCDSPSGNITPVKNLFPEHLDFWKKFLNEDFPQGKINSVLEKNLALWLISNEFDMRYVLDKYKNHGWNFKPLLGWIRKVNNGSLTEYNPGEVYLWAREVGRTDLVNLFSKVGPTFGNELKLISDAELESYEDKKTQWLVEPFIKSEGTTILASKRGMYKSWLSLALAYSVANGLNFLEKFQTTKGGVLYVDRENSIPELKKRSAMIKRGLVVNSSNVFFISESYLKIDNALDLNRLETIIRENDISLVIFDVLRRLISCDENDAGEISKLFIDHLKPLSERTGVSFLILHHERKGISSGDDLDMLRGSSDLANYVDSVIQLERRSDKLLIKQSKNRSARELEPFQVKINTDSISSFSFEYLGIPQTTTTVISKAIVEWILKSSLKEISYSSILKYTKNLGYKKTSVISAINDLNSRGLLLKGATSKSPYTVAKDLNLEGFL